MLRYSSAPLTQLQADALVVEIDCVNSEPMDAFRRASEVFPDLPDACRSHFDAGEIEPGKLLVLPPTDSRKTTVFLAPSRVHPKGELRPEPIRLVAKSALEESLRRGFHSLALLPFEAGHSLDANDIRKELLCSFARSPDLDLIWVCEDEREGGSPRVSIFTDGSAEPCGGKGGYGAILRIGDHTKEISGGFQSTSSNRMELMAAVAGLEALNRPCQVRLHSDSRFVVDTVNNGLLFRRAAAGWKKKKIPAVDLWKRFFQQYLKHNVEVIWVKAHAGIEDNHRCDRMAADAMLAKSLHVDEGYKPENRSKRNKKTESGVRPHSETDSQTENFRRSNESPSPSAPDQELNANPADRFLDPPVNRIPTVADRESADRNTADRSTADKNAGSTSPSMCGGCGHRLEKREAIRQRPDATRLSTWYLYCTQCQNFYHLNASALGRDDDADSSNPHTTNIPDSVPPDSANSEIKTSVTNHSPDKAPS